MEKTSKIILKLVGLQLLIIFFFTLNGAYVTMTTPTSPAMQYIGLVPLAMILLLYLIVTRRWKDYFSLHSIKPNKTMLSLTWPLILVLIIVFIGNGGINSDFSITSLLLILVIQLIVVAFIEEMFFRGFMLKILSSKGFKVAVIVSSVLFALTHSLQLLGGQSIESTIVQIVYAFVVGLVLSLLIINKQSIVIAIVFHGVNNFLQMAGQSEGSILSSYIIVAILILHAIFLWFRATNLSISRVSQEDKSFQAGIK